MLHCAPFGKQRLSLGSQQPPALHIAPAQQTAPDVPQAVHVPPEQIVPEAVQAA